jgi:hypothetical protein
MVETQVLNISRFSLYVSMGNVNSLIEQLKRFSTVWTRLKTTFKTQASLDISLTENKFPTIYSPRLWPDRCLKAPLYGRLNPDQIFSSDSEVTSNVVAWYGE